MQVLTRFIALLLASYASAAGPKLLLGSTTLTGLALSNPDLEFFGGIPFAQPPVGDLRLAPPVLMEALNVSELNASNFGPSCIQVPPVPGQSEDCLMVNVLRPASIPKGARLPVFMWVYGGGFFQGDTSLYNGTSVVARSVERGTPIVFVSANYRLGPLGFPQGEEAQARGAANLGLRDILTTLQWVQKNIATFGGDENKVTVFGNSAGAIALSVLWLNPAIDRYIRAVIFESGSPATTFTFPTARREDDWTNFVSAVSECAHACRGDTFGCLRQANESTISSASSFSLGAAQEGFPFVPTLDGPEGLYPELPSILLSRGEFARIPIITGDVLDEGTMFVPTTFNSSQQMHEWIIANITPSSFPLPELDAIAAKLMELYPDVPSLGSPYNTGDDTFGLSSQYKRESAYVGDANFHSQRRALMQTTVEFGVKTFGYLFTDPQPSLPADQGVAHGSEWRYLFNQIQEPTQTALKLATDMLDYWISFAVNLDPNDKHGNINRTLWPEYKRGEHLLLQLNGANTTAVRDDFREEQITFINSIPLPLRHKRFANWLQQT